MSKQKERLSKQQWQRKNRAKLFKKNEKEVAKHYKAEYERMLEKRNDGETGRLEFEDYL